VERVALIPVEGDLSRAGILAGLRARGRLARITRVADRRLQRVVDAGADRTRTALVQLQGEPSNASEIDVRQARVFGGRVGLHEFHPEEIANVLIEKTQVHPEEARDLRLEAEL